MSTLTGKTVADTYLDLLHVNNSNEGVSSEISYIHTGTGSKTPLGISTESISLSSNMLVTENAEYDIGSPQKRLATVHTNKLQLNGVDVTLNPSENQLAINGVPISTRDDAEQPDSGTPGIIGQNYLSELSHGEWTLQDGEFVGQTKVITTTGDEEETQDTVIDIVTFACGTEITFKGRPGVRQAVTLVYGSAGWVVTGRSHNYESEDKGPIVT